MLVIFFFIQKKMFIFAKSLKLKKDMKHIHKVTLLLLLGIALFYTACFNGFDYKVDAVERITITGKVVDEDANPIENCKIIICQSPGFMGWGVYSRKDTITNNSGEFFLDFFPRQYIEHGGAFYIKVEKSNYTQNGTYTINNTKSKQNFEIVIRNNVH